jgi:gas vesicle protein
MSRKSKFTLGAIVGAAVGVVAGLLTAPKSGKETRADLRKKADDVKAAASDKVSQAKTEADKLKKRTVNAALGAQEGFNKKVE